LKYAIIILKIFVKAIQIAVRNVIILVRLLFFKMRTKFDQKYVNKKFFFIYFGKSSSKVLNLSLSNKKMSCMTKGGNCFTRRLGGGGVRRRKLRKKLILTLS